MTSDPNRDAQPSAAGPRGAPPPVLEAVIEVPRFGFVKRGATDTVDFVSPLPCPFNYGAVAHLVGGDGDLLDAVVLGPRRPRGATVRAPAWGAVGLTDRGIYDDKLILSARPVGPAARRAIVAFFHLYAAAKRVLNLWRGRPGRTACEGWRDAAGAIARARPRAPGPWRGPPVPF